MKGSDIFINGDLIEMFISTICERNGVFDNFSKFIASVPFNAFAGKHRLSIRHLYMLEDFDEYVKI